MSSFVEEITRFKEMLANGWSTLEIGRSFVEAGGAETSQSAQRAECAYIKQQQQIVAVTGRCDGRCEPTELITLPRGDVVCRRTREPCVRLQATTELEMWSRINREPIE